MRDSVIGSLVLRGGGMCHCYESCKNKQEGSEGEIDSIFILADYILRDIDFESNL